MSATENETIQNNNDNNNDNNNVVLIRGTRCFLHQWEAATTTTRTTAAAPKSLVVIYHGFGAHGNYPTVKYAAEFLSQAGHAVVAFDFPGHGRSEGLEEYIASSDDLIEDGVSMAQHAMSLYNNNNDNDNNNDNNDAKKIPLVLCGSSMGGAIALLVAHRMMKQNKKNNNNNSVPPQPPLLLLLAPMLGLNVSSIERTALSVLNFVAPTARLIPSSSKDASKQYRDATKRKECETDPLCRSGGGKMRVGSALACVDTALTAREVFADSTNPYLLLVADEDVVVDNRGAEDFHQSNGSDDKTKHHYPSLHGLLCEPSPLFDTIKADVLEWLEKRTR